MIDEGFATMVDDPAVMFAACELAGLPVTLEACLGILGAADVSEENAYTALERMGLQMVLEPQI